MGEESFLEINEVEQVLNERLKKFKPHHTYALFKLKIEGNYSSPLYGLDKSDLNFKLEEIVRRNAHLSKIEEQFDYGLGGIMNIVFHIPYEGYRLYFALDIGKLVLINLYKESDSLNKLNYLNLFLISSKQNSDLRKWSEEISYMNRTFYVINTYEAFYEFSRAISGLKSEPNRSINDMLWEDFTLFIRNQPGLGGYEFIQVDNVLIICNFNYDEPVNYFTKVITE